MNFNDLDNKMRIYETTNDRSVLPNIYIVARIDGRGFTKLTKESVDFDVPFDVRFRDYMIETVRHLMDCGFKIIYGYTQSDEISLLFDLNDNAFSRKVRKLVSVLAGEASAKFSTLLGIPAAFDCRISELPNLDLVIDYFRWRNEDATRNSLNAHCYWLLRKQSYSPAEAARYLSSKSIAEKNEILFQAGINFNDLALWQKRGVGLYWKEFIHMGFNPKLGEIVNTTRNQIFVDYELPIKEKYTDLIKMILETKRIKI